MTKGSKNPPKTAKVTEAAESGGELLTELLIKAEDQHQSIGLLNVPSDEEPDEELTGEVEKILDETETAAKKLGLSKGEDGSWAKARDIIESFKPVPWFIVRLSSSVLGQPGQIRPITDGGVLGLRRLVFAAASDSFLGTGRKVSNIHQALQSVPSDVIAATAVIHAVCRRLAACDFERIWRPILDDALLRAQIGFLVGERTPAFGPGRGMLAGFAGRCGLAILIGSGTLDQARRSLELLAGGEQISKVGLALYGCDPLQISAMTLSAAGCGRDAAFGTVRFASPLLNQDMIEETQLHWLSAFTIVEKVRTGRHKEIDERFWEALGFVIGQDRGDLAGVAETMLRRGHPWPWIL